MFGCWAVVQRWGYHAPAGWRGSDRPDWTTYAVFAIVAVIVCALPLILPAFVGGVTNLLFGLVGQSTQTGGERLGRQVLTDNKSLVSTASRVAVTVATYLHATALIFTTGGIRDSPFAQIPIAVVILAPIIMTSIRTQIVNLVFGIIYVIFLFGMNKSDLVSSLPAQTVDGNIELLQVRTVVEPAITIVVVLCSLGLTALRAWGQQARVVGPVVGS